MTRLALPRLPAGQLLTVLALAAPLSAQAVPDVEASPAVAMEDALKASMAARRLPAMRFGDISDVRAAARGLYEAGGWTPLWLDSAGMPTPAAKALVGRLGALAAHGLDPDDYDAALHKQVLARIEAGTPWMGTVALAEFDTRLTADGLRYLGAMRHGRVRLRWKDSLAIERSFMTVRRAPTDSVAELISALRLAQDPGRELLTIEDRGPSYRALQAGLADYRARAADTAGQVPLRLPTRLVPGAHWDGIAALRALLRRTGDLIDTLPAPSAEADTTYSPELVAAIKRLQRREGLAPDGVIGTKTAQHLANPFRTPVRALVLALERARTLPDPPTDSVYIEVNIPEFRLRVRDPMRDTTLFGMNVVVGGKGRNETPELASTVDMIVFSPTWRIPPRILREDIIPKVLQDTNYLTKQGMELVRDGKVVQATFDNVALIGDSVGVRQRSGGGNSLGKVKFLFANSYGVYLHDTPTRSTFRRAQRAESHGCVRLEDAPSLATWLLRDDGTWDQQRLREAMKAPEPVDVDLTATVPVRLVYQTASLGPHGTVEFHPDVYGRDRYLEQALGTGYPFPSRATPLQQLQRVRKNH